MSEWGWENHNNCFGHLSLPTCPRISQPTLSSRGELLSPTYLSYFLLRLSPPPPKRQVTLHNFISFHLTNKWWWVGGWSSGGGESCEILFSLGKKEPSEWAKWGCIGVRCGSTLWPKKKLHFLNVALKLVPFGDESKTGRIEQVLLNEQKLQYTYSMRTYKNASKEGMQDIIWY